MDLDSLEQIGADQAFFFGIYLLHGSYELTFILRKRGRRYQLDYLACLMGNTKDLLYWEKLGGQLKYEVNPWKAW